MKLRVFVIDDEEGIRNVFRDYLEFLGHEVVDAEEPFGCDVYSGCDCQGSHPCGDILFIDYHMPRMTGLEFVECLHQRGCKGNPEHKFLMSGNVFDIDMQRAKEIGCTVLEKPVSLSQIAEIVETVKSRLLPERKLKDLNNLSANTA